MPILVERIGTNTTGALKVGTNYLPIPASVARVVYSRETNRTRGTNFDADLGH